MKTKQEQKNSSNAAYAIKKKTAEVAAGLLSSGTDVIASESLPAVAEIQTIERKKERVPRVPKEWKTSLQKQVSEEFLLKRHRELLNKRDREVVVVGMGFAQEVKIIDKGVDVTAVSKGLELGYKLHGKLSGDPPKEPQKGNVYNMFFLPEVQEQVRNFENAIKARIINSNDKKTDKKDPSVEVAEKGSKD